MNFNVYEDIAQRTNGDIYLGIVGPVRTGKSTFIKKFMEKLVIPNIQEEFEAIRANDELPQSGSGRTIMTTEPKFVPNEAISINLDESSVMKVRLIDCVGYLIDDVIGFSEEGVPRMVMTPWSDTPVTFTKAAETGTQKVIQDHSTIGILVTTDGSIVDIPRERYVLAEERVVNELKEINKPFVIIINSRYPHSQEVLALKSQLSEKYNASVIPVDVLNMEVSDITAILKEVLYDFPIKEIKFNVPVWFKALDDTDSLKADTLNYIMEMTQGAVKIRDITKESPQEGPNINFALDRVDLGNGEVAFKLGVDEKVFYDIINNDSTVQLNNKLDLVNYFRQLSQINIEYSKIKTALSSAQSKGYGIVLPESGELKLENPEIIGHGKRYAMKLKASAPSIHLISALVDTEVTPFVGTQSECERIMVEMMDQFNEDPEKMWQMEIFGKNLNDLVMTNLYTKISRMSDENQEKIKGTLSKVLNENGRGIVFIII